MSPVDRAGQVTGTNHVRNFSPVSEMRNGQRSWGRVLAPKSRNQVDMAKHNNFNVRADHSFGNCITALNGMLMKWKIQQAMQDDAIQSARIHSAFISKTGLNCSYGKVCSSLTEIRGN